MGLNEAALTWLRDHHGVISSTKLLSYGLSRAGIQRLVASGRLIRMHPGVYRIASQPLTLDARCAALCMFQPNGFVTGPTGGTLRQLRRMPKAGPLLPPIHFAMPHGGRLDIPGVQIRQSRVVEPTDVQIRDDGIRLATPWRLAFDLAADLGAEDLESVIEQILSMKLCQFVTLAATAKRLARTSRPGSTAFVRALGARLPGGPLESHPELRIAKALQAKGVPIVVQTTWLGLPNGGRARLDISVPDIRWGVEIDIHPDHFLQQGTADRRRDRQCHLVGWQVDRVTAIDMLDMPTLTAELVELYVTRRAEITGRT